MAHSDTIVALATPPGRGGIGIVRVSGPGVPQVAEAVLGGLPQPRAATLKRFGDGDGGSLDEGIALFFPAPASYTGEDVLELQGHGGPVVTDLIVQRIVSLGVRLARPGEFSERAFLNGKLDLAQAEAVADLIEASSATAARSAVRSLQGDFSRRIQAVVTRLTDLRVFVEAAIDFPDEEIDFLAESDVETRLAALLESLDTLLASTRQGCLLRDGLNVVLAGPPNAGKSSLLNALAQRDRAIVSPVPGTTRDLLEQPVQLDGLALHFTDTAGLRDAGDEIESEGVRRALAAVGTADLVLLVVDDTEATTADIARLRGELPAEAELVLVRNKVDLSGTAPGLVQAASPATIALSAKTGAGLAALRDHLKATVGYQQAGETSFIARRRHLEALQVARARVEGARQRLYRERAGELVAEELRLAQQALGEITGPLASDELLGKIFASFCIGK